MNEGWNNYTLEDIISLNKESVKVAEFNDQIYLGLEHVEQNSFALNGIGNAKDVTSNKYIFKSNQVLYGKIRPYFRKVYKPDFSGICSTDFLIFSTRDPEKLNQDYLYSFIRTQEFTDKATEMSSGTKMPRADWSLLKKLEYPFPPVKEQKAIASILSALDDKIELNLQMNKTLEEMAMTLYKHWFVDFGPFKDGKFVESELGMIPEGWEVKEIGDLLEHTIGGDWGKAKKDESHINLANVIRGTDLSSVEDGDLTKVPIRWIKESKYKTRKLQDGDIIIEISGGSTDQPTGRSLYVNSALINLFEGSVIPTSFCRLMRAKTTESSIIIALHLKYIYAVGKTWFYQNQSTGISNFQFKFFQKEEKIAMPSSRLIHDFYKLVSPLYNKRYNGENRSLIKLRDTLLPKLISGQLRLKEFEKQVTEAL